MRSSMRSGCARSQDSSMCPAARASRFLAPLAMMVIVLSL